VIQDEENRPWIQMGVPGFEPGTSALSELRSSQLSYTPAKTCPKALRNLNRRVRFVNKQSK
jgi:hypothetical protein